MVNNNKTTSSSNIMITGNDELVTARSLLAKMTYILLLSYFADLLSDYYIPPWEYLTQMYKTWHECAKNYKWPHNVAQPALTCSKIAIETLKQGVKYVQI